MDYCQSINWAGSGIGSCITDTVLPCFVTDPKQQQYPAFTKALPCSSHSLFAETKHNHVLLAGWRCCPSVWEIYGKLVSQWRLYTSSVGTSTKVAGRYQHRKMHCSSLIAMVILITAAVVCRGRTGAVTAQFHHSPQEPH